MREPLKPLPPADDHESVLPCMSEMVTMVLLNEALTCTTPVVTFLRALFLTRASDGRRPLRALPIDRVAGLRTR